MSLLQTIRNTTLSTALALLCSTTAMSQDARALRAQAETEPNQEKQVMLLCKAADLDLKNKEYRRDCDVSRSALISADRQALKTAQDASDSGQPVKAKRYAKYVSSLDPDLHKQAEQLLAKLDAPVAPPPPTTSQPAQPAGPTQSILLAQAAAAYQSGNLAAARTAAQNVTDPALRPLANQILTEIDRYSNAVTAGQRHDQPKNPVGESSNQSAAGATPHAAPATTQATNNTQVARVPAAPQPVVSLQDKVKALLEQASSLKKSKDSIGAGKRCRQVLDLDPANSDARHCLDDLTAELNKDPVRLEKTLRDAIVAFYASRFEDAESGLNRYVGADSAKKKGAAYFYLGASAATRALLEDASKRAARTREAEDDFKQARADNYQPVEKYVSARVLSVWKSTGL